MPFLELRICQRTSNQVLSGDLVFSKIVPLMTLKR